MQDDGRVLELVVDRAQAQLDAQLAADDAVDLKALGVLAADAAVFGVLVAAHSGLDAYWWVPTIVLGLAAIVLLGVVYPTELDIGPRWTAWYETFGGETPVEVGERMLVDLTATIDANRRHLRRNGQIFKAGFALMLLGFGGSVLVVLVR